MSLSHSETLKEAVTKLLFRVAYYERSDQPRGPENVYSEADFDGPHWHLLRPVGLSHGEIHEILREQFPEHAWRNRTCIYWYLTKLRAQGNDVGAPPNLPRRPRTSNWRKLSPQTS